MIVSRIVILVTKVIDVLFADFDAYFCLFEIQFSRDHFIILIKQEKGQNAMLLHAFADFKPNSIHEVFVLELLGHYGTVTILLVILKYTHRSLLIGCWYQPRCFIAMRRLHVSCI